MTSFTAETRSFRREAQRKDKNLSDSLRILCASAVKNHNRQIGLI